MVIIWRSPSGSVFTRGEGGEGGEREVRARSESMKEAAPVDAAAALGQCSRGSKPEATKRVWRVFADTGWLGGGREEEEDQEGSASGRDAPRMK
jgi:hypothetical protein